MEYTEISYCSAGRIATITLNRPERLNAISLAMPQQLAHAVETANRDDDVHVIVLTGEGRAFCSGYDLIDFAETEGEQPGSQLGGGDGESAGTPGVQEFCSTPPTHEVTPVEAHAPTPQLVFSGT